MMTATHSDSALKELRRIVDGSGGSVAVVCGAIGPFYAGVRRAPVKTLLEAILSVMADRTVYERIAVLSARGQHLPSGVSFGTFRVGESGGGWLYHGTKPGTEPAPVATPSTASDSFLKMSDVGKIFQRPDQVLFRKSDGKWLIEVEGILEQLEILVNRSEGSPGNAPRSLILLDEMLIRPSGSHLGHPDPLGEGTKSKIVKSLSGIPDLVSRTKVDLVLFAQNAHTATSLREGRMIQDDAYRHLQAQHPNQELDEGYFNTHPMSHAFPAFGWRNFQSCVWPAIDSHHPHGPFFGSAMGDEKLYNVLRHAAPTRPRSFVRRAEDPRRVLVEFWSTIDVPGLKAHLEENVIGQRLAIARVTEGLERFSATCQDVINSKRVAPEKEAFFPPAFLFTGESGMGKTYLAEVIADFLFGADYFEKLELTQRTPDAELMGGDVGYIGHEAVPAFLKFCKRTGGMGLFTFDELDKVKRLQSARLSDAVAPFLGVLQDRQLKPKSPGHSNHVDERTYFRNLILVFTANAVESGERPGYELLTNFGTPLLGRLKTKVPFTALESQDVHSAVQFFVKKYLKRIQADLLLEHDVVTVEPELTAAMAQDFDKKTRDRIESRSLRTLESFVDDQLPDVSLKQRLRAGSRHITSAELNSRPWKP